MKNIILALFISTALISCAKESDQPQPIQVATSFYSDNDITIDTVKMYKANAGSNLSIRFGITVSKISNVSKLNLFVNNFAIGGDITPATGELFVYQNNVSSYTNNDDYTLKITKTNGQIITTKTFKVKY